MKNKQSAVLLAQALNYPMDTAQ